MTAPGPQLSLGDTGEWVLRLQTRLQALGLFEDALDEAFGQTTKAAVTQLQEHAGLPGDGAVDDETWAALAQAEQQAGLQDPFAHADGDPAAVADPPVGALSEDQQWKWDGERWQPKNQLGSVDNAPAEHPDGHVSADGQWLWDGSQWQPVS